MLSPNQASDPPKSVTHPSFSPIQAARHYFMVDLLFPIRARADHLVRCFFRRPLFIVTFCPEVLSKSSQLTN